MKKLLFIMIIATYGCESREQKMHDRLDSLSVSQKTHEIADSLMTKVKSDVAMSDYDKSISTCPIKITKADVYSDYIEIDVKNNSGKKADGIKFSWILYNNFNDQVGDENGISQKDLLPKMEGRYSWRYYPKAATKIKAYIYSIHYVDGATWQLN